MRNEVQEALHILNLHRSEWASLSLEVRLERIEKAIGALQKSKHSLASLICDETGKPLSMAEAEIDFCISTFRAYSQEFKESFATETVLAADGESEINYSPLGTVAIFSPFNSVIECTYLALLPALAAGNTVIVKPSPLASRSAGAFIDIFRSCLGDVVVSLNGGSDVGETLVQSDVQMVVFTGSVSVGRKIAQAAAAQLKKVVLELGGKDPLIVLPDADLDKAVEMAIEGAFSFAGQICTASEQVWIQQNQASEFLKRISTRLESLGDKAHSPMISAAAAMRVHHLIRASIADGAKLEYGGNLISERVVEPTILSRIRPDMTIAQTEIFGPVVCLNTYSQIDDIPDVMKESEFALGATILGTDTEKAKTLARQLPHAAVGINRSCIGVQGTPWFGNRMSGLGLLGSKEGHRQFCTRQVITF